MTVFKAQATISGSFENHTYIAFQHGVLVEVNGRQIVDLGTYCVDYDSSWHPTKAQAWQAVADELDKIADTISTQADAARNRATQEVATN